MKIAIFADIHANLSALQACYDHFKALDLDSAKVVILGDYVDYGPRPNETVDFITGMKPDYVLRGNHESALFHDESKRFSSKRGVESSTYTRSLLNENSWSFLSIHESGQLEFEDEEGRRILLVHGDLSDVFWGKMPAEEMASDRYRIYDFVISGHTHIPHLKEIFFEVDDPLRRNKKKIMFLNPGSVGQPRNHCKHAQYLIVDTATETFSFQKVLYDIEGEQKFFSDKVDSFYRERLSVGL